MIDAADVLLRPETPSDDAFLLALYGSTREDLDAMNCTAAQKSALVRMQFSARQQQFRQAYPRGNASIIVAKGEPIGRFVMNRGEEAFVLVDIALLPTHRNLGIGTALVVALLHDAAIAGKPVRLRVLPDSRAVRLYERLGFSQVGDAGTYLDMQSPADRT